MNSIRQLVGIGTGASALCVMALVVASASVLAHASDQTVREAASARTIATEDQKERAAMKALWVAARSACGDQPEPAETKGTTSAAAASTACADAKTALKNALAGWKVHEMSETGTIAEHSAADWQEDQAEFAAMKSLWQTAATACGFSFEQFGHHSK